MEPFVSWPHLGIMATILVPIALAWWTDRKERKSMHEANQDKLDKILEGEKYLPQHFHAEKSGPLTAEGIQLKHVNGIR